MNQFLTSTDVEGGTSPHIKRILSGKDVRIATAFLGKGAENVVHAGSRLVCDIGMGGTNPVALEELSKMLGDNLRYHFDFHAKVYLSDQGCLVGSANLSSRGVGFLSQAKLIEAALLVAADDLAAKAADQWFEGLWENAHIVGPDEIAWARKTWQSSKRGTPQGNRTYKTLLQALEDEGGVAGNWKYLVTREQHPKGFLKMATALEGEVIRNCGWQPKNKLTVYSELSAAEALDGFYIGLHRGGRGKLELTALRFVGNLNLPDENDPGHTTTASYFSVLPWSETGFPGLTVIEQGPKSSLSNALASSTKEKWFGRALDVAKFAKIIRKGA